jgi:hypothetical protein
MNHKSDKREQKMELLGSIGNLKSFCDFCFLLSLIKKPSKGLELLEGGIVTDF